MAQLEYWFELLFEPSAQALDSARAKG